MFLRWLGVVIHNCDHSIGEENQVSKTILESLVSSRAIKGDLVLINNKQPT